MAFELEVKWRGGECTTSALESAVRSTLDELGIQGQLQFSAPIDASWGAEEQRSTVSFDAVHVGLLCHRAGSESALGAHGGFWVTASAAPSRTGLGALFATVLAIGVATEADSNVFDDLCLLGAGRDVAPRKALRRLKEIIGEGALDEKAARMAKLLGLQWST